MISPGSRVAVAAAIASLASLAYAQETPFRSRSDLVIVPATVTDQTGRFVRGLTAADFEILEDGGRRPVAQFTAQRVPVSVAIVLDISGSMSTEPDRWELTRRALSSFLSRLEGSDEVTVIVFNDRPQRLGGWTRHTFDVFNALGRVRTGGGTALFRALLSAVPALGEASYARNVVLLISDGNDHDRFAPWVTSKRTQGIRTADAIRRSGAALYAIGIGRGHEPVNRLTLGDLSEPTGAYFEIVSSGSTLEAAVGRVADDLRGQYILGFEPAHSDGAFHSIVVRTRSAEHRVRARSGYVASRAIP